MGTPIACTPIPDHSSFHDVDDTPKDECGVLAISTPHGDGVAQLAHGGAGGVDGVPSRQVFGPKPDIENVL